MRYKYFSSLSHLHYNTFGNFQEPMSAPKLPHKWHPRLSGYGERGGNSSWIEVYYFALFKDLLLVQL